ncbi:MAG: hypothetical protein IH865_10845 [Chloroflexi bacterium]|nr:hypothetical protein [Chloroflexota bacterium]
MARKDKGHKEKKRPKKDKAKKGLSKPPGLAAPPAPVPRVRTRRDE